MRLPLWADRQGGWKVFDSFGGFRLPDGSVRSPDALLRLEAAEVLEGGPHFPVACGWCWPRSGTPEPGVPARNGRDSFGRSWLNSERGIQRSSGELALSHKGIRHPLCDAVTLQTPTL